MKLIHTLLLLVRKDREPEDLRLLTKCLKSLEKSTHKTVVVYNQGFWKVERTKEFLKDFNLECIVIGDDENMGIVVGRQRSFQYIWDNHPETEFISELHLDMVFTHNWEDPLIDYLNAHDEPVIGCGIVDAGGSLPTACKRTGAIPDDLSEADEYLRNLREDLVLDGFTHPCIHRSSILKEIGGYDTRFLIGKHAFEDDSALLGYFYYYGTKRAWRPKVCYRSVVYHATAVQRMSLNLGMWENFHGLIKQYGVMGIMQLSRIHSSPMSARFFASETNKRL